MSIDSRMVGEDASDDVELGNRECPRIEKVGLVGGDKTSADDVDDVERWSPSPIGADSGESILFRFMRSSTSWGSLSWINSRIMVTGEGMN